jgi:hypothetical protein
LAKTWVLETQTKGTGATVVPLESVVTRKRQPDVTPGFSFPPLKPIDDGTSQRAPRLFKVTDVMTGQLLADDVEARDAVEVLEGVRSIVDITVHVWEPTAERWRMLSFGETKALWDYRGRVGSAPLALEPVSS